MKEYQLEITLTIDPDRVDAFLARLLNLVESMGGTLGGGIIPLPKGQEDVKPQPEPLQDEPAD